MKNLFFSCCFFSVTTLIAQPTFSPPIDIEPIGATTVFAEDLDNDGDVDIAAFEGGKHNAGAKVFAWYENKGNDVWTKHGFHSSISPGPFTGDSEAADFNGDGFMDFALLVDQHNSTGNSFVYWWENPMGSGGSATDDWIPHVVAQNMTNCFHMQGLDIVDMDLDGKLDIVARNLGTSAFRIYFQNTLDNWTERVIPIRKREGQKVADLDRDGTPDVIFNGFWLAGPTNPRTDTYQEFTIEDDYYTLPTSGLNNSVKIDVNDIDKDGINDVLFSVAEGATVRLAWFKCPNNPRTQAWVETTIENNFQNCHQAILTDLDNDGDLDIAGGYAFNTNGVENWYNMDGVGGSWSAQIVDASGGMYSEVVADIDNDGDMDLIGPSAYHRNVKIYKNQLDPNINTGPLSDPNQLTISSNDSLTLVLNWQDNSNNESGFEIWRAVDGNAFSLLQTVNSGVIVFTDQTTDYSRTYEYRIRAINNTNISNFTNTVSYLTKPDPFTGPLSNPNLLTISSPDSLALVLNWSDNSINETGFEIWRAVGGGALALFQTVGIGVTNYTDQATVYSTNYSYEIRAINNTNVSGFSNTSSYLTGSGPDINSGLLAYWKMDDGQGTIATEEFNQYPGTLGTGVSWNTEGKLDGASEFDGTLGRMNIGTIDVDPNALTISFWMKADDFDQVEGRFISKASGVNGSQHYWMVSCISGTGLRFRLQTSNGGTTTLISATGVLSPNTWHFVTATYDQNTMKIYLDCNEVASVAKAGAILTNPAVPATIGNQPVGAGDRPFDGLMDDVRIYNKALNQSEICQLYNYIPTRAVTLNIQLWLEGVYSTTTNDMSGASLYDLGLLPGQTPSNPLFTPTPAGQPYSIAPWNYSGMEGTNWEDSNYTNDVVDWVLISLRSSPAKTEEFYQGVGVLKTSGMVELISDMPLTPAEVNNAYIYVSHRNHLSIISDGPVQLDADLETLSYDFRTQNSLVNGGFGQKELTTGVWALYTGDILKTNAGNADINSNDKQFWSQNNGLFGLNVASDLDMDGDVSASDNVLWSRNNGIFSTVVD